MDGYKFEKKCAAMLRRQGFTHVRLTGGSGDQGVDILAQKRRRTYGIQCKYYTKPVGNHAVQQAYAGARFYDCDMAAVMTNSTYTEAARELADRTGVLLWETKATGFGTRPHLWWLSLTGLAALPVMFCMLLRSIGLDTGTESVFPDWVSGWIRAAAAGLMGNDLFRSGTDTVFLSVQMKILLRIEIIMTAAGAVLCLWNRRSHFLALAAAAAYLTAIGCEIAVRDQMAWESGRPAAILLALTGSALLAFLYLIRRRQEAFSAVSEPGQNTYADIR